jgi:para-aminobenzoate synthetase component 2
LNHILLIDNNDSFTYNLKQLFEENNCKVSIVNNLELSHHKLDNYSAVVISPGPGNPSDYTMLFDFLRDNYSRIKILGVCLGHQVIGEFFGGKNEKLKQVHHGARSPIIISGNSQHFGKIDKYSEINGGRYHSWALSKVNFPDCLVITSVDSEGVIMSFEHKELPIFGIQFHPESYMTDFGDELIRAWLEI